MSWLSRFRALALVVMAGGIELLAAGDPPAKGVASSGRLYVMVSDSTFATVNRTDALTSMKVYIDAIAARRSWHFDSKILISTTAEEVGRALQEKRMDLMVLDMLDYVQVIKTQPMDVVGAGSMRGVLPTHQYFVLVRDPAITNLAGLAGKTVLVTSRTKSDFGMAWLESQLADSRLGKAKAHFASVTTGYRASSCVLPLFFGKADACVVDSINYELMKELNPQLGKLTVIARSEPLFEALIAISKEPHPLRAEIMEAIMELHKYPAGDQLMTVFRVGPTVKVPPSLLESVIRYYHKIYRLGPPSPKKGATGP